MPKFVMILSLLTILTQLPTFAFAENAPSAFRFDGELRLDTIYTAKPSADTGKTEFKLPALGLNVEKDITSETMVRGSMQFGPDRTLAIGQTSVGQFRAVAEEALISSKNFLADNDQIRYGLITHPWIDLVGSVWNYSSFTDGGSVLLSRLNYTFRADLGMSYQYKFSDWISSTLWILNGEGILRDEVYASKDTGLMFKFYLSKSDEASTLLSFGYVTGRYDNFPSSTNQKERTHFLLAYVRQLGFSFGLEGFQGRDSVDAITQQQGFGIDFANGADLSSKGGQSAQSTAGALYTRYSFENADKKKYEFLLKGEYLQPMSTMSLWTWFYMWGLAYIPNDKMTFMLADNHTVYNEGNYGVGRRETDRVFFTLRAIF